MSERLAGNWLKGFQYFTSESESPNSYLLWCALVTLGGALRRRVCVKWRYTPIYPNIYVKLVGPPGTGKGQAISFARRFLTRSSIPVSAESGSREGLIMDIVEKRQLQEINGILYETSPYVVLSPDFMSFYRTSGDTMIEWLTEIFDSGDFEEEPWTYRLRNRPEEQIPRPYISMIAGTTESWIAENFSQAFTDQGYAARVIFVYARKPRFYKARPAITTEMWEMADKLLEDLKQISSLQGEFKVTEDAWKWFEPWYNDTLPKQKLDDRLQGYLGRKALHLWKVAMLLQIAGSDELVITSEILQLALAQLENLEPMMVQAFQGVGKNPISGDYVKIYNDILTNTRVTKGDLLIRHAYNLSSEQLDEIINNLQLMGKISLNAAGNGTIYYTATNPNAVS